MDAVTEWLGRIWERLEHLEPLAVAIEIGGVLIAVGGWLLSQRHRLKPSEYVAKVEKSRSCAAAASNAVHTLWKDDPLLSREEYWELVKHNPDVLVSIFNEENKMVGFFDVFPLKAAAAEAFLDGETTEKSLLTPEAVYDARHADQSNYIYIGTVLGLPRMLRSAEKLRLEYSMIRPMLKYLEDRFPPRPDRLYFAMGSSKLGLNWLNECGFTPRSIPSFAGGKLRHIHQLKSEKMKEARRNARHLGTKFHTGKLLSIKCQWHRGHANDESTAPS
jgi:hypothetical protein